MRPGQAPKPVEALPDWALRWPEAAWDAQGGPRQGLEQEAPWCHAPWAEAWERLHSAELAAGFAEWCPVAGQGPEAYRSRLLALGEGRWLLAGIRFRGGRLDWPFVELWPNFLWERAQQLQAAAALVAEAYAPFRPKAFRWHLGPGQSLLAPEAWVDQSTWVGRLGPLRQRPAQPAPEGFQLARPQDLAWYPDAVAAHARFQAQSGPWAQQVRLESLEDLTEAQAQGSLVVASHEGHWVGLAAALPEAWLGQPGWLMVEELVAPEWAGRGLGRALQRALLESLPATEEAWLWGTILEANLASQRVATGCGRQAVQGSAFYPLPWA